MTRGGYKCPITWCTHRDYTPTLIAQHVREEHPSARPIEHRHLEETP